MSDTPTVLRGGEDEIPDEGDHSSPDDWMVPARNDGADWSEIRDHVSDAYQSAEADGHAPDDIDRYLGYGSSHPTTDRAADGFAQKMEDDPGLLTRVADGVMSLFGSHREDYAKALRNNEVKNPQDFADAYAAGALRAGAPGSGTGGLDPQNEDEVNKRLRGAAASAEGLAANLPTRADFIDAAMSLTDDQEQQKKLRDKMLDTWQQTGTSPRDQAKAMRNDDGLRDTALGSFIHGVTESVLPGLGSLLGAGAAGAAVGTLAGGPLGTIPGLLVGLAGAVAGGGVTAWAQHEVLGVFPDTAKWLGLDPRTQKWDQEHHPYLNFVGGLAGGAAGLTPFAEGASFAQRFAQRQISSALQGGVEGANEYFTDGKVDWTKVSAAAASGQLFPGLNPLGQHVMIFGPHTGFAQDGTMTTRLTDFTSPTGYKDVPFAEAAHDPLLHAEAQEMAREPGFFNTLAQSESGKLDLEGGGGAKERPKFSFKEPEGGQEEDNSGFGRKNFELHRDGEPIGAAQVSFPPDRPGVAMLDNIAADERSGALGPRAVRDLAKQFFGMHPDVNTIEGWRVSGARLKEGSGPGTMTIDREQVERSGRDAAVKELAQGYHAAESVYAEGHSLFGSLVRDNSGSLRLGGLVGNPKRGLGDHTDPGQIESAKDFYDRTMRTIRGNIGAKLRHYDDVLEPFYKEIGPHMATFKAEHDAGKIDWSKPVANLYSYIEHRSTGAKLAMSKWQPLADSFRDMNEWQREMKLAAEEKGLVNPTKNWDDWYAHRFDRVADAESIFRANGQLGSGASFKERKEPDIRTATDAGAKLREVNPIDNQKITMAQSALYLQTRLALDEAINQGYGQWGKQLPGTTRIDGVTNAKGESAFMNSGYAQLWHNDISSTGFFKTKAGEEAYDTWRRATNMTTGVKLVNASVHMTQINLGVMGEMLGEAFADLGRGQLGSALYHTVSALPVIGPTLKHVEGRAVERVMQRFIAGDVSPAKSAFEKFVAGNDDTIIQNLINSNPAYLTRSGRGTSEQMSNSSLWQAIGRNTAGDTIGEKMGNLTRAAIGHESEQWGRVLGIGTEDPNYISTGVKMAPRALGAIANDAGVLMHTATNAIFGNGKVALIPNIQRGVAADMMRSYIKRNPTATREQMEKRSIQINNEIENRLGELNQDNAYWNKSAKQFANATMLSTGWKFGTYAWLSQAFGRNIRTGQWEFDPVSMRSTVGALAGWAALTTTANYLMAGTLPWQTDTPMKDLIWFRSGGQPNASGTPRRGQIFGEQKELIDIAKAFYSSVSDPMHLPGAMMDYVLGATNPAFQFAKGVMTGEDAIGHKISQYPGGWERFAEEQFSPIMRTMHDQTVKGTGIPEWSQQAFGLRDAPKFGQDPDAFLAGMQGIRNKWSKEELTRARKEAAKLEHAEWLNDYINQRAAEMKATGAAYKTRTRTPRP